MCRPESYARALNARALYDRIRKGESLKMQSCAARGGSPGHHGHHGLRATAAQPDTNALKQYDHTIRLSRYDLSGTAVL